MKLKDWHLLKRLCISYLLKYMVGCHVISASKVIFLFLVFFKAFVYIGICEIMAFGRLLFFHAQNSFANNSRLLWNSTKHQVLMSFIPFISSEIVLCRLLLSRRHLSADWKLFCGRSFTPAARQWKRDNAEKIIIY